MSGANSAGKRSIRVELLPYHIDMGTTKRTGKYMLLYLTARVNPIFVICVLFVGL